MTNTEKINLIFEAAKFLAGLWRRFGYPVAFDRVLTIDGVDVRVIVEDLKLSVRSPGESEIDSLTSDRDTSS